MKFVARRLPFNLVNGENGRRVDNFKTFYRCFLSHATIFQHDTVQLESWKILPGSSRRWLIWKKFYECKEEEKDRGGFLLFKANEMLAKADYQCAQVLSFYNPTLFFSHLLQKPPYQFLRASHNKSYEILFSFSLSKMCSPNVREKLYLALAFNTEKSKILMIFLTRPDTVDEWKMCFCCYRCCPHSGDLLVLNFSSLFFYRIIMDFFATSASKSFPVADELRYTFT